MRGLQGFGDTSKLCLLVFLELWLGTYLSSCGSEQGVKHMTFLELWLKMTDEHEGLLSCGSGQRVLPV